MKIVANTIAIIFLLNSCLYGQTELEILEQYETPIEWQTPTSRIDSILNLVFDGGSKRFLEIIYKNLKLESKHQDNWVKNYLVEIEVSQKELNIKFRNHPITVDKWNITQAINKTTKFWKNSDSINLKILISSDTENKFNKYISQAYIQSNIYRMVSFSNCEDECLFERNEELGHRIENLLRISEEEGAIYYLKILTRRIPFDKEINKKLWALVSQKNKN